MNVLIIIQIATQFNHDGVIFIAYSKIASIKGITWRTY